jgi:hypothetical protein
MAIAPPRIVVDGTPEKSLPTSSIVAEAIG